MCQHRFIVKLVIVRRSWSAKILYFLSFHCRVPVGTLSGLQCSGVVTWTQALTTKQISPGYLFTLTTEALMWRYRTLLVMFNSGETSGQSLLKSILFYVMYPLATLSLLGSEDRWRFCSGSVPFPEHPAPVRAPTSPRVVLLCPRWCQCLLLPQRAGRAWPSLPHGA